MGKKGGEKATWGARDGLSNEKDNETLIALMPILSVEDLYGCIQMIISVSKVVSSSWSFGSAVLGQMTYLVASSKLESARSYVMQGASFTQGTVSSIPIGGSISPKGFLSSILLLVVIIVTVLIVAVILVVVVIAIVGVVIVVVFIGIVVVVGGVSSIFKLSFMIIGVLRRIDLECVKCHMLKIENEKLKEEAIRLTKFEKTSSSGTEKIKFVKAQKKASSDGGPINMGGPILCRWPPKKLWNRQSLRLDLRKVCLFKNLFGS
ncbi:hypothetical protein Tco_0333386 [Tanacetum coccineum]